MAGPPENGSCLTASLYRCLGGAAGIAGDAIDRHAVNLMLTPPRLASRSADFANFSMEITT